MGPGPQSRHHSLANILWQVIWVVWTVYKKMRNPAPRKNCRHFLLEGLIHYGRQRHFLEIKCWTREHLESSIITFFPPSQPLELWLYHQFDDKRQFRQINPRWPPSTSWKINVWNRAHTVRYKYTFPLKQPWRVRFWYIVYN